MIATTDTTENKILRDGYGAWISDPSRAVRRAVKENIVGVFINKDGSVKKSGPANEEKGQKSPSNKK